MKIQIGSHTIKPFTKAELKAMDHALALLHNMDSEFITKAEKKSAMSMRNKMDKNQIAWIK